MAQIIKNYASMALPSGIKRGTAAALDNTSVWYNYDLMVAYAKGGSTAEAAGVAITSYVGQILTFVDKTNKTATAYVITDEIGSLKEVGSATLGDDKTLSLTSGILGLKNWGVQYYKWVEGAEGEDGKHELQIVDTDHPWIAGLEPRATTATDGTIELAWYQPSTTTIDGVSSAITSVQSTVDNLSKGIGSAEDEAGADTVYGAINNVKKENAELKTAISGMLPLAGGTMTGDITLKDGSIAASESVVDSKIATAIGSAGHLKREIVSWLPEVEDADPDTIYMVLNTAGTYNEYILVDGKFELIGDTNVDLTSYMKKVEGAASNNFAVFNSNGEVIDSALNANSFVPSSHLDGFIAHVTKEEREAWNAKVDSANETYLVLSNNAEKLANLPAFTSVGEGLEIKDGILISNKTLEIPVASDTVLGGIKIDNRSTEIDENGVLSIRVNSESGLSIGENGITLANASATNAGAMSAEHFVKLSNIASNAQVNVIEGALIGSDQAVINDQKELVIPVSTLDVFGVVKSSESNNQIKVEEDGTMTVNKVATSKIYVEDGDEFILDGGNA